MFEMKIILLAVCALVAATTAQDCDTLNKECHHWGHGDHTLCIYPENNPNIVDRGVSPEDIEVILKGLNDERSKIALGKETRGVGGGEPPAALMNKLVYDKDLAEVAQRWADQGVPSGHDSCRQDPRWDEVGQNGAAEEGNYKNGQDKSRDWKRMIEGWFNEVNDFVPSKDLPSYDKSRELKIGHYTQAAWGNSSHVGCGFSMNKYNGPDNYSKIYMCNFGPAGNWYGQPVYQVGEPCSKCVGQCDPNVGLCEA